MLRYKLHTISDKIERRDLFVEEIKNIVDTVEIDYPDYIFSNNLIMNPNFLPFASKYPECLSKHAFCNILASTSNISEILSYDNKILPYIIRILNFNSFVKEYKNFTYDWENIFSSITDSNLLNPLVPFYFRINKTFDYHIIINILYKIFYNYDKDELIEYQDLSQDSINTLVFTIFHINELTEDLKLEFIYYYNKCCLTDKSKDNYCNLFLATNHSDICWLRENTYKDDDSLSSKEDNKYSFYTNWNHK